MVELVIRVLGSNAATCNPRRPGIGVGPPVWAPVWYGHPVSELRQLRTGRYLHAAVRRISLCCSCLVSVFKKAYRSVLRPCGTL